MTQTLTLQQEQFCHLYLVGGVATAAYRGSYNCKQSSGNTVKRKASALLKNPKVAAYIGNHQRETTKTLQVSREEVIAQLQSLYERASSEGKYSAAVQAIALQSRLLGFLPYREANNPTSSIETMTEKEVDDAIAKVKTQIADLYTANTASTEYR